MIFPPVPDRIVFIRLSPWTDRRVELLKKLTEEGMFASQIACELGGGITRNAVIGKQHRIGVRSKRSRGAYEGSNNHPNNRAPTRRYKRAPWAVDGLLASGKPPAQRANIMELEREHAENPKKLLDLQPDECRWPVEGRGAEALFCSAPVYERYSYCWDHCCRAFTYRRQ